MKRQLLILILALLGLSATAQTPNGWWIGILEEAGLPLNLNITEKEGEPWAVFYSPLQQKGPMVTSSCKFKGDTLIYNSKSISLKIKLIYRHENNTWHGTFQQGFVSAKMDFEPTDTLYEPRRPQTPKAPFPYDSKEVLLTRKKADVTLTGTLTMPIDIDPGFSRGKAPLHPAVVLVSGSGQQNRDEELMGHKPFAVLADYLSRQGIAVLRYDDRGMGGSHGEIANATTLDFADDAEAMMNWLRKQPGIDPRRVGIIGHSEGGMIAPIVASRNKHTKFVVLLAGPGYAGSEVLLQQNKVLLQAQGLDSAQLDIRLRFMAALFAGDTNADRLLAPFSKEELKAMGLNSGSVALIKKQIAIPWFQAFLKIDPARYLTKTKCPILAINGEKDMQVIGPENLSRIKELAPHAQTHLMPGLNHLMQHCQKGTPNEYMLIEETLSEDVMALIVQFVNSLN